MTTYKAEEGGDGCPSPTDDNEACRYSDKQMVAIFNSQSNIYRLNLIKSLDNCKANF